MGKDPDEIRREIEDTRDRMGDAVDEIAYRADVPGRVKDSIADRIDGVKSAVSGTARRVGSAVTGTTSRVGSSVSSVVPDPSELRSRAGKAAGMIKENPIGMLLSGSAIGFLLGSLLPSTDLENERIGELSDNLKEQAQQVGSQALEHGKAVLRETAQAAQSAAQQSATEHGQQFADETREQVSTITER